MTEHIIFDGLCQGCVLLLQLRDAPGSAKLDLHQWTNMSYSTWPYIALRPALYAPVTP